jgi:hypothetical protein
MESTMEEHEPTLEERAAAALAALASLMPTQEEAISGTPLPEWMGAKWLAPLTDPADPQFANSVAEAEAWLGDR